jgi:DNA-binding CsgD family transcriptional regulator
VTLPVVEASPYWKTTWQEAGTLDGITVPLTRNVVYGSAWTAARAIELGAFPDEALEFMRLVAPHIRRAIEISGLLARQKQMQGTMQEVLEAISAAAFVLAPDGAIRFRNSAAEALLAEGNHIRLSNGRLLALSPTIRSMIEGVASGGVQTARDMMVETRGGQALQVTCARLDRIEKDMDAPLLLLLRQPEPDLKTPISIISSAYGLTTSETIVLGQILEGRTLDEAAELIGVARSTVKTHLDAIYAKSGVRRQTDLMRKIAGLIAPIG